MPLKFQLPIVYFVNDAVKTDVRLYEFLAFPICGCSRQTNAHKLARMARQEGRRLNESDFSYPSLQPSVVVTVGRIGQHNPRVADRDLLNRLDVCRWAMTARPDEPVSLSIAPATCPEIRCAALGEAAQQRHPTDPS
jgi:hypothetical protein